MTGFAALETRVNAAVVGRLANATATVVEPSDVAGQTFTGIFDAAYQVIDQATGIPSSTPVLTAQVADFPDSVVDALEEGDTVSFTLDVDALTYVVVEPQPDGTGMTALRLRKAA